MLILLSDLNGTGHIVVDSHRIIFVQDIPGGSKVVLETGDLDYTILEVTESAEEVFDLCNET